MANINSTSLRNNLVQSLTMSGNLTWAKADFKGKFTVFLSATGSTRTLTISNTGFVAGDFICLLIDQNSSTAVSITIGTRSIATNKGNIINAIFDGTNWNVWSGGSVFNTSNADFGRASIGLRCLAGDGVDANVVSVGYNVNNTGDTSIGLGSDITITGARSLVTGSSSSSSANQTTELGVWTNDNGFANTTNIGVGTLARRYGGIRQFLNNAGGQTDSSNPSGSLEICSWRGVTTNNTITEIFLRGVASNRCVLQAKNVIAFKGQAVAFKSDYTGSAVFSIEGMIKRDGANNTTLVGHTKTKSHSDGTGNTVDLTISADDTNESLRIQVTGNASENWTWLVELELLDLRIA